ncbi:hypothetical protein [Thalassomonas sp. RHCl1]|uniref:hypothetical protein n=1 Tax=Thalassomonas sp. RHCl1 TaxID=2995320 RepID=UPI00248C4D16|nr:hypothetical protein [Thalassomonas sp. RHCl1]
MAKKDFFYEAYKKNLCNFFKFLSADTRVSQALVKTLSEIKTNQQVLQAATKSKKVKVDLPSFEIPLLNSVKCGVDTDSFLSIGGKIEFNEQGIVNQSISACLIIRPHEDTKVCEKNATGVMKAGNKYIIRRFHFDIDSSQTSKDRPISHVQYGGNIQDEQKGSSEYQLINSIDLPRIPSFPLDVVQVINFLMDQFDTTLKQQFKLPSWRGIVVDNDAIWKKYFFEKMISKTSKRKTMYEWACDPISF